MIWTWDYFTIAYIVLILLFIFIGLKKGFINSLLSLVGVLASFIIAFLLAKPIGNALFSSFGTGLTNTIDASIVAKYPELGQPISGSVEAVLPNILTSIGIPSGLHGMIIPFIVSSIPASATNIVLSTYISGGLSNLVYIVGSFLVLFILLTIIFFIVKLVTKKLIKKIKLVSWVDKLLGFLTYGAIAVVIIAVFSYGLTFFVSLNNGFSDAIIAQLHLNDDTIMTPSKWIYEYNILQKIFDAYL